MRGVERDANGNLFAARSAAARIDYTLRSRAQRAAAALAADVAATPSGDAPPGRFLQLPPLGDEVRALALRITLGAESDAARAAALERHLRRVGRYSDTPPTLDPDDPRSPIEVFLSRGLAGHCEYFATAMAVLGRSVGLPTRLATGFAGGRVNTLGGFVELAHADAHAWVEIHFLRAGWVRYDPTPPALRLRPDRAASFGERLLEIASAIEYWYFDRIVDFDRNDQIRGLTAGWRAWRRLHAQAARNRSDDPGSASWRDSLARLSRRHALVAIAALVALVLAVRRRPRSARARAAGPYADALRLLARRRGLVRPPSHAPRAFARHVRAELPDEAGSVFAHLTESYLAERFGGRSGLHAAEQLQRLRRSLRAHSATR